MLMKGSVNMKRLLALLSLSLVTLLSGCANGVIWRDNTPTTQLNGQLSMASGTYQGTGMGLHGEIIVEVTVSENDIQNLQVVEHSDTLEFATMAFDNLIPAIISTNSTGLDIVSGATHSSQGLLQATEDALQTAGADLSLVRTLGGGGFGITTFTPGTYVGYSSSGFGGSISLEATFSSTRLQDVYIIHHNEEGSIPQEALEILVERVVADNSANVAVVGGATITSNAFMEALYYAVNTARLAPGEQLVTVAIDIPEGNFNFIPGAYEATVNSMHGDLSLEIVVTENTITEINVQHVDTPFIADPAIDHLTTAVLSTQNVEVDVYSGATETSEAFKEALQATVNMAQGM